MERTLICDISSYQDANSTTYRPDLNKMKDAGIQGVILTGLGKSLFRF